MRAAVGGGRGSPPGAGRGGGDVRGPRRITGVEAPPATRAHRYRGAGLHVVVLRTTRIARRRHVLWMIEHHPDAELMMLSVITIDPSGHALADQEGYDQAKNLWIQQVDRHPDDVSILMRGAHFVRLWDKALALKFLK